MQEELKNDSISELKQQIQRELELELQKKSPIQLTQRISPQLKSQFESPNEKLLIQISNNKAEKLLLEQMEREKLLQEEQFHHINFSPREQPKKKYKEALEVVKRGENLMDNIMASAQRLTNEESSSKRRLELLQETEFQKMSTNLVQPTIFDLEPQKIQISTVLHRHAIKNMMHQATPQQPNKVDILNAVHNKKMILKLHFLFYTFEKD